MKDKVYIYSRLLDTNASIHGQDIKSVLVHRARVEILQWIYNTGNIQPENIIRIRKKNFEEELYAYKLCNDKSYMPDIVQAKLMEINNILEDK